MKDEIAIMLGPTRADSHVNTVECSWTKIPGKFLSGWAGGVRDKFSLVGAQGKCVQLGAAQCGGVTCTKDLRECTVRKASQAFRSLSGEVSGPTFAHIPPETRAQTPAQITYSPAPNCFEGSYTRGCI